MEQYKDIYSDYKKLYFVDNYGWDSPSYCNLVGIKEETLAEKRLRVQKEKEDKSQKLKEKKEVRAAKKGNTAIRKRIKG